jgi:uncharacterized protein (DUF362 family)/Pyruvate/2-oxoacid:ferredoxin oxidoreductase delta subunit
MISHDVMNDATVCILKSKYETIDLDSLLQPLGTINNFIKKGERVLLKPNLLNASIPEKRVVTDPSLVKKTAELVLKSGGIPFIGDSPSGRFTKRRLNKVYEKAGLLGLSRDLGIELNYDTNTTKVPIPNGKLLKKMPLCNFILKADKIIALPKLKTHAYMIMTLATKIMYGAVPGLNKSKYHSLFIRGYSFSDLLLDILSVAKPNLIIMDGIIGMQGNGPAGGKPVNLGVLLAAENAIAMDIAICEMLDIEPVGITVLKRAKLRRLWPNKITYPQQTPNDVKYTGFILPVTAGYLLTGTKPPQQSPKVTSKCISCGLCEETCPKSAITNKPERAQIDYNKCIRCYCCHEICPEEAIELEVLAKIIQ